MRIEYSRMLAVMLTLAAPSPRMLEGRWTQTGRPHCSEAASRYFSPAHLLAA